MAFERLPEGLQSCFQHTLRRRLPGPPPGGMRPVEQSILQLPKTCRRPSRRGLRGRRNAPRRDGNPSATRSRRRPPGRQHR